MTNRIGFQEFLASCGGMVGGYRLRPGQALPETYDQLLAFMVDRLEISPDETSLDGLTRYLLRAERHPESCSPEIDTEHVEAVVLIGELPNPDSYVAQLPFSPAGDGLVLPHAEVVRHLLPSQSS